MQKKYCVFICVLFIFLSTGYSEKREDSMLQDAIKQFAPTVLKFDASLLDDRQMKVLEKLYQAAKIMDDLFLEQVYSGNKELKKSLELSADEAEREYFKIMFGPFDRLEHNKPFIGNKKKPLGANFYPEDMTKEEFNAWIEAHPEDKGAFTSEFTVIRREDDKLVAIPYSEYYKEPLTKASQLLNEAAEYADNPSLKRYLLTRAKAFLSNDYYESDMAWMDLKDHAIEVVIGPYEVYEDEFFNYKAAFECFLTIKDPEESKKLSIFAKYLSEIEQNLPIPDKYKNFDRGSESPIMVVQEVFSAGDTKAGVQTLAFNLPNDERVREAKGSKKVMLKNMHEAKFEKQLIPIAQKVLDKSQIEYVSFDAFFNHTLMHEISHGVGPGKIKINGRETEVKNELKETYSKLEECKADVLGMYNNKFMVDKGIYSESDLKPMWSTFLAGIFRSVRFGINEAHGAGNAIIYNYLLEKGAYVFDESTETVKVNYDIIYEKVRELAERILRIQAEGDYEASVALIDKYAYESPSLKRMVAKLKDLPVDIKPKFQIEEIFGDSKL
jgi:hypothetical protein